VDYRNAVSACLLCVLFFASCLNANKKSNKRQVRVAPARIVRELLGSIDGTKYTSKLLELAGTLPR
jgi:hypothetical protein